MITEKTTKSHFHKVGGVRDFLRAPHTVPGTWLVHSRSSINICGRMSAAYVNKGIFLIHFFIVHFFP